MFMTIVLLACGIQAEYAPLMIRGCISVGFAPAKYMYRPYDVHKMYRIKQSLSYLYNLVHAGHYQCYCEFKQFNPIVLICVETNWPCSGFAMVVLGCRVTCAR